MTLRRTDIMAALLTVVTSLQDPDGFPLFPPDLEVDAGDFETWRPIAGGLQDSGNILSGEFEPTINAGSSLEWEGARDATVVYAAAGANRPARVARRDLVVPALAARLAADRTMGAGDPQVWAELGKSTEDDAAPVADAGPISTAVIGVSITYVAASAAG